MIDPNDFNLRQAYESFGNSVEERLLPELKNGIWHTTSPQGYVGIRAAGSIHPNGGQFPYSFPQSKNNYGVKRGWVCLFDFASAPREKCVFVHEQWGKFFFGQHAGFTVAIELERTKLPHLIPNADAQGDAESVLIGWVEAWHTNPIPITAAKRYLFIGRNGAIRCSLGSDDPRHNDLIENISAG